MLTVYYKACPSRLTVLLGMIRALHCLSQRYHWLVMKKWRELMLHCKLVPSDLHGQSESDLPLIADKECWMGEWHTEEEVSSPARAQGINATSVEQHGGKVAQQWSHSWLWATGKGVFFFQLSSQKSNYLNEPVSSLWVVDTRIWSCQTDCSIASPATQFSKCTLTQICMACHKASDASYYMAEWIYCCIVFKRLIMVTNTDVINSLSCRNSWARFRRSLSEFCLASLWAWALRKTSSPRYYHFSLVDTGLWLLWLSWALLLKVGRLNCLLCRIAYNSRPEIFLACSFLRLLCCSVWGALYKVILQPECTPGYTCTSAWVASTDMSMHCKADCLQPRNYSM